MVQVIPPHRRSALVDDGEKREKPFLITRPWWDFLYTLWQRVGEFETLQLQETLDGATITAADVAVGDKMLFQDADDSDNLKQDSAADLFTRMFQLATISSATVAAGDLILVRDITDSNAVKTVTASSVGALGGGGGGRTLIEEQTPSGAASVDFTTGISSTYDVYELEFLGVTLASDGRLDCRVSQDGGSTFKSGATDYGWASVLKTAGAALTPYGNNSDDEMTITGDWDGNASEAGINGRLWFFQPAGTSHHKQFEWSLHGRQALSDTYVHADGGGRFTLNASAIDGVQIYGRDIADSAGVNISGTLRLWGHSTS